MSKAEEIKQQIFSLIEQYHNEKFPSKQFVKGQSPVPVSGKVFDAEELKYITESALDGWFTTGRFNDEFEKKLAKFIGCKKAITVNSGSSANLLAFATLTAEELGDRALKPGDEMVSVAVSFPTTINPALSYGIVPVLVDIDIPTYNIDVNKVEAAITPKTKAIMVAHTLGNPFNVEKIKEIAARHNLWLIEDSGLRSITDMWEPLATSPH